MKWLTLLAFAASPAFGSQVIQPQMNSITWQIHLSAENKEATYGNCTLAYKGIVLANRSFKGIDSFDIKGTFKIRADVKEVQVRCAVKGFNTYTETVAVTSGGVRVDHCLTNPRIFQQPVVDLDQGAARVHLKIPQFRREKVVVNNQTFLQLTTPDKDVLSASYSGLPYLPEVPQTSFYIALPLDAQVSSIVVKPGPLADGINMLLVPQAAQNVGDTNPTGDPIFNEKAYTSRDSEILLERHATFQTIVDKEKNLVRVSLPLVDYSVKQGTVRFYDDADVIINFKAASRCFRPPFWGRDAVDTLRASTLVGLRALALNPQDIQSVCRSDAPVLRRMPILPPVEQPAPMSAVANSSRLTLNPAVLEQLRDVNARALALASGPNLVIVTDRRFHAQAVDLAAHKESIGIRTAVIDWPSGSTAEDLKAQLQKAADALRPNYLQWVLLLGDVDSIPTFYDDGEGWVQIGDEAHTAGDAYYVQWQNPETYVPSQDPDASIGRIPAKTPEELQAVIDRIKNYDNNPPTLDTFYTSPTITGTFEMKSIDMGSGANFASTIENSLGEKFLSAGFRPERFYLRTLLGREGQRPTYWERGSTIDYPRLTAPQDQNPKLLFHLDASQSLIDGAVKRGTNMLFYRGHGMFNYWNQPEYRFTGQNFDLRPENMPPVVFAIACLSGFFDNETVHDGHVLTRTSDLAAASVAERYMAESMLLNPKGALGVVASSRQSNRVWNRTLVDGLARSLVDRKAEDNSALSQRLGDVMTDAKVYAKKASTATSNDPAGTQTQNRHHMLAYNLLGDPSVEVRQTLPLAVNGTPTLSYDAERSTLTVRFQIYSPACTGCDMNLQADQPIAVLMGRENQPVSRGVATVVRTENGQNREVVLTGVTNFNSVNHTLYLSNAGLATYKMVTGPRIPIIR